MEAIVKKTSRFGLFLIMVLSGSAGLNGCEKHDVKWFPMPNIESQSNTPIIAVYNISATRIRDVNIIHLIWADGTVVFSKNPIQGGAPYFKAEVPKSVIAVFFRDLAKKDISWEYHIPPDADSTVIAVTIDGRKKETLSSHELYELTGNWVGTDKGLEVLGNRSIEEVRSQQSLEYQKFRTDWDFLREEISTMIPLTGEVFEGQSFELIYE